MFVTFLVFVAAGCGDAKNANEKEETSSASGAVKANDQPPEEDGVDYPLVFSVDANAQEKMDAIAAHNAALDAKCQAMLGDVAPIESDGTGVVVDYGCPRPPENIKLEHWGAN